MSSDNDSRNDADRRHKPKQLRGVETRNSILEAAMVIFAERGYEQTTTHQIAGHAGISVGTIYRYFSDKENILKEIYLQEVLGLRKRILDGFNVVEIVTKDVRELVREALRMAFRIYSECPALWRVLIEQSRKIPEMVELRRGQEVELYQTVQQILKATPRVRLPDIEAGAYLISLFLQSLIEDYILYERDHVEFDDERIIEVAVDFILKYVLSASPQPA